jgi:PadR family transcriptional regulator PadR
LDRSTRKGSHHAIQQTSEEELPEEHGALYPALQRLEERGWSSAEWRTSSKNRNTRFYSLAAGGRQQLIKETAKWKRVAAAIGGS